MVELVLRNRVERRGRLVKDHQRSVLIEHTRDREFLALAAGKFDTFFRELMGQRRVELHRQRIDLLHKAAVRERLPYFALIDARARNSATIRQLRIALRFISAHSTQSTRAGTIHIIQHHIFLHRAGENLEVLEYRADRVAVCFDIVLPYIDTVGEDPTLTRIIKTHQQLDQRGLARAVIADERDLLTRVHLHGNIRQHPRETLLIGEAHTLEGKCFCRRRRDRIPLRNNLRLISQEVTDLLDIQARLAGLRIRLCKDTHASLKI